MNDEMFKRLKHYFYSVADGLRADAAKASIFSNPSDIGVTREMAYVKFLAKHVPSKCNVRLGGFLFDDDANLTCI